MANLLRSAKSASDWGPNELIAYNIHIQDTDQATFFGLAQLPQSTVSPIILNNLNMANVPAPVAKPDRLFFRYMQLAQADDALKAQTDDFAKFLFELLDYDNILGQPLALCQKFDLNLPMGGISVCAKPSLCVIDGSNEALVRLVDENKVRFFRTLNQSIADERNSRM